MPFVDAGMKKLLEEPYMHNRLRMNTSSYLRTDLLIDYCESGSLGSILSTGF